MQAWNMQIQQKRVLSTRKVLGPLLPDTHFRVVVAVANLLVGKLTQSGFSANPQPGDTVLPTAVGTVTKFNANGRYDDRRDLPKVSRYITTVEWTWKQWAGRGRTETVTEDRPVYRDCYQRDFVPPPASELTIVDNNGVLLVVSEELTNTPAQDDHNRHIINVFLELFGECEIRHANLQAITPPAIRKVNWSLLPPGRYPWSQIQQHVQQLLGRRNPRSANPILHRIAKLASYNPDEVYIGHGGFRSYVAYVYTAKKLAVLESVELDNATYVFDRNWQQVSQMTKAQILQGNLHLDRVIHAANWNQRIDGLLR